MYCTVRACVSRLEKERRRSNVDVARWKSRLDRGGGKEDGLLLTGMARNALEVKVLGKKFQPLYHGRHTWNNIYKVATLYRVDHTNGVKLRIRSNKSKGFISSAQQNTNF